MKNSSTNPKKIVDPTSTMTEFQKFMYYSERLSALKELRKLWLSLWCDAGVSDQKFYPRIKKEFGINGDQWYAYYSGKEPLPYDFLWRFRRIFRPELETARIKQHNDSINAAIEDMKLFNRVSEKSFSKIRNGNPISSPEKATA